MLTAVSDAIRPMTATTPFRRSAGACTYRGALSRPTWWPGSRPAT